MFNLFHWIQPQESTHPSDQSQSTPPESLKDLHETLARIEYKLDLILSKFECIKEVETETDVNPTIKDAANKTSCASTPPSHSDFVSELIRKVEERKIAKHMGASHGFTSIICSGTDTPIVPDKPEDVSGTRSVPLTPFLEPPL
jgi:hypothetical protein